MTALAAPISAVPDFKIHTGPAELFQPSGIAQELPLIRMIGSSTELDLHGDTMKRSALDDMCSVEAGLSIWLNHDYTLPNSLYGVLHDKPSIVTKGGVADLYIDVRTVLSNPEAARTYGYIKVDGVRIGCSVGCQVLEYEIEGVKDQLDNEEVMWAMLKGAAVYITKVRTVEWSLVGIPANQRSWVENAIKGVFARTLDMQLAPAVKGMFPGAYHRYVQDIEDLDLRQKYLTIEARPPRGEVRWNPNTDIFDFCSIAGETKPYTREGIRSMLEREKKASANAGVGTPTPPTEPITKADDADKEAQKSRSKRYGIGIKDGGHVTKPGEWASVPDSQYGDPVNYRYPMPNEKQARAAWSYWNQSGNQDQYNSNERGIIGGRIKRRCRSLGIELSEDKKDEWEYDEETITWEQFQASWDTTVEVDLEVKDGSEQPGVTPPPTNLIPRNPDEPVRTESETGDHDPMTGNHTHAHKAYGMKSDGSMHIHEHEHQDDSDHNHSHDGDEGMNLTPDEVKALKSLVAHMTKKDYTAPDTNPNWGRIASLVITADNAVDEVLQILGVPDIDRTSETSDSSAGMSEARNAIDAGKSYGEFLTKAIPQEHLRHAQRAHDAIASLADGIHCNGAVTVPAEPNQLKSLAEHHRLAGIVHDALMAVTDGMVCPGSNMSAKDIGDRYAERLKKAVSHDDMRQVQRAHDAVATMCAGMHCAGAVSVPSEPNEIAGATSVPAEPNQIASAPPMSTKSLPEHHRLCGVVHDSLMKMSDGLVCPGSQQKAAPLGDQNGSAQSMQQAVDQAAQSRERDPSMTIGQTLQLSIDGLNKTLGEMNIVEMRKELELLKSETEKARQEYEQLTSMPLGRPTAFNRSLTTASGATMFAQADEAVEGTDIRYIPGIGRCRHWPAGVQKDARPELQPAQLMTMTSDAIAAYMEGGEATVLIVD